MSQIHNGHEWRLPTVGCVIPRFLSQINSASISFGELWFQDTQNIFVFPEQIFLRSPKDPLSLKKWIFKLLRLPCWWYSKLRGVLTGPLKNISEKTNMFWVSWNYRWPNETLAELIWDKNGGMTHPRHGYRKGSPNYSECILLYSLQILEVL